LTTLLSGTQGRAVSPANLPARKQRSSPAVEEVAP